MKRVTVILLLILYGSTNVGATIHLHYCMDRLVRMNLWETEDDKCGRCGMKEKKAGCCEDKKIHLKLKVDQQKSLISKYLSTFSLSPIFLPQVKSFTLSENLNPEIYPGWNKPPLISPTPIYIRNCVFII